MRYLQLYFLLVSIPLRKESSWLYMLWTRALIQLIWLYRFGVAWSKEALLQTEYNAIILGGLSYTILNPPWFFPTLSLLVAWCAQIAYSSFEAARDPPTINSIRRHISTGCTLVTKSLREYVQSRPVRSALLGSSVHVRLSHSSESCLSNTTSIVDVYKALGRRDVTTTLLASHQNFYIIIYIHIPEWCFKNWRRKKYGRKCGPWILNWYAKVINLDLRKQDCVRQIGSDLCIYCTLDAVWWVDYNRHDRLLYNALYLKSARSCGTSWGAYR